MKSKKFFNKKKIIYLIILILIGSGAFYYFKNSKKSNSNIQTIIVNPQDIKATVLNTGEVLSALNLNLSFQSGGVLKSLKVKVGDKVKANQILATLDQDNARASLLSAQGALAQARANYQKVVSGFSPEVINIAEKNLNSAQIATNNAQNQLEIIKKTSSADIKQAQKTLDDLQDPNTVADNKRSAIVLVLANQVAGLQAHYNQEKLILDDNNLKDTFGVMNVSNLNLFKKYYGEVPDYLNQAQIALQQAQNYKSDTNIDQAILKVSTALNKNLDALNTCYSALQDSIVSSKFSQAQLDTYKNSIHQDIIAENSGISGINSARQALSSALRTAQNNLVNVKLNASQKISSAENQIKSSQAAFQEAQANLKQKKAKAQPSDIAIARAQIISAQGNLAAAQVRFDNTILRAPQEGTITTVDTKIGQQVRAFQEVIVLKNLNSLHAEAEISESNIASLRIGQKVDYTFDALGPDRHFSGKIYEINPASTIISGVVNYLIKATLPNIPEIKPGMTANMSIVVANKKQALAVPSGALIYDKGNTYLRLITNPETKTYRKILVQTGLQADDGLVEIKSGLEPGQEIVTYSKS